MCLQNNVLSHAKIAKVARNFWRLIKYTVFAADAINVKDGNKIIIRVAKHTLGDILIYLA